MSIQADVLLDCTGMKCPRPVVEMAKRMRRMETGQVVELLSDDPVAKADVPSWCDTTGNHLLGREDVAEVFHFYVRKAGSGPAWAQRRRR